MHPLPAPVAFRPPPPRRPIRWAALASAAWALWSLAPPSARADFSGFPEVDVNSLVSDEVVDALVNLVGTGFQHRPYEPATPQGLSVGADVSVEATLIKIPDGFFDALASLGGGGGSLGGSGVQALPLPRLHLHKGFGDRLDIGVSGIWLSGSKVLGTDAKIVLLQAEEGPTWAFRFCYTYSDISIEGINISAKSFAPQLLVSRQMEFADPYLGVGLVYATGAIDADVSGQVASQVPAGLPVPAIGALHKTSTAYGGMAFGGISLKVPRSGLRVTVEMSYNSAGTSTLGAKAGFNF